MSSDEEELAELRAARAIATGKGPQTSLAALREQQRRAEEAQAARSAVLKPTDDSDAPRPPPTASFGPPRPPKANPSQAATQEEHAAPARKAKQRQEEDVEWKDEDDVLNDSMRQFLPLSFGDKPKGPDTAKIMSQFHAQTKRAAFGPPKPPQPVVGPPRPPAQGSAGDTQQADDTSGQGQGDQQDAAEEQEEAAEVGPPRPPPADEEHDSEPASGTGEGDDDGVEYPDDDPYLLPLSHEVVLGSAHARGVTCMELEHSGSRLITGSMDQTIRIYDFNGMKRDMKAFREIEPQEGHPVLSVSWSPTGDQFLVVTGASQAKIYDRDGHTLGEFVRGDMYIRDMKNTKGHVSGLTSGVWHPTDRWTVMTSSDDGTVRIWDTANFLQKTVIKPSLQKPGRVAVTTCSYGQEGRLIAAGLMDGSIQLWGVSGKFGSSAAVGQVLPPSAQMIEKQNWSYVSRPNQLVRDAHEAQSEITSLTFSRDGHTLLSRSMDSTVKVWDLRNFKKPLKTVMDLPCAYQTSKVIFSPDESLIVTGVSAGRDEEGGALVFIDKSKLEIVRKVGMPSSVSAVAWHPRLNQIFVGTGNRKTGATRVLYDPERSERGVLIGASRAPRKPSPFDLTPEQIARAALEAPFPGPRRLTGRKRKEQEAQEALKHHKPDPGMAAGMGKQGRIGTTSKTLLTQHLLKKRGDLKPPDLEMDPREAILRHADKKDVFSQFTAAYAATQPKPIFAQEEEEEEEES